MQDTGELAWGYCGESCAYAISLRRFIQPKPANSLHGLDMKTKSFPPASVGIHPPAASRLQCWASSSHTPYLWTTATLTWLACLSLLATVPRLDIRWRGTDPDSMCIQFKWASVFVKRERVMRTWKRNEKFWRNMKRLLGQYSDRQNKMQCK